MSVQEKSPGERKVDEYVDRIKGGESEESIMQDLPEGFKSMIRKSLSVDSENKEADDEKSIIPPRYRGLSSEILNDIWVVREYMDPEITKAEKARKAKALVLLKKREQIEEEKAASENKANDIRVSMGLPEVNVGDNNTEALLKLKDLLDKKAEKLQKEGRSDVLVSGIRNLFNKHKDSRRATSNNLMSLIYSDLRSADYKNENPTAYQEAWTFATTDGSLPHKIENGWIYRGNMKSVGKKTETRASLNVNIDKNVVSGLDNLISTGKIDANYKFGDPGEPTDADGRHDAITIYFLTEPDEGALRAIEQVTRGGVRGDNLLGKKIADGFYLSEIGSISDSYAKELINKLSSIDSDLSKALNEFLVSNVDGKGERTAMSEAQFYAVQQTLELYGYSIKYDSSNGFEIIKR